MCLSHCSKKTCKQCRYRPESPSKGYPLTKKYLEKLNEQSDDGDVLSEFVTRFCI
jgi:hypothetical protein